jgi:hypothetical protein
MSFSRYAPTFSRLYRGLPAAVRPGGWVTWRNTRRVLAGAASLATVIALFYALENWRGRRAMDAALQDARDWGALRADVPEDENFAKAPVILELSRLRRERPSEWEKRWGFGESTRSRMRPSNPGLSFPPFDSSGNGMDEWRAYLGTEDILGYFETRSEDMAKFAEATRRPGYAWDVRLQFSDLQEYFGGITALYEALNPFMVRSGARMERDDGAGAAEDIGTILRVVALRQQERLTLGHMLANVEADQAIGLIRLGLRDGVWTEEQLIAFEDQLARIDFLTSAVRGFRSDAELFVSASRSQATIREALKESKGIGRVKGELLPVGWILQNGADVVRCAEERLLPCWDLAKRRVDLTRLRALDLERRGSAGPYTWFSSRWLNDLAHVSGSMTRAEARVGQARLALALERWRLTHGEYPPSLSEMPAAPTGEVRDPVTGEPFRYARAGDGRSFQLYSLGPNARDDGGKPAGMDANGRERVEGDWVW